MKKKIVIDISETGEVNLETHNYKGPTCVKDSQFIKDILGEETYYCLCPVYYQKQGQEINQYKSICG